MLSILIPTYNDDCYELVQALTLQAKALNLADWEIIVADDGSTDGQVIARNKNLQDIPGCRFVRNNDNMGRAAIRNFLVEQARGEYLIFIDADMKICEPNYLKRYVMAQALGNVVYGGYIVQGGTKTNLRFLYEKQGEKNRSAQLRNNLPYKDFHTSNFMVSRKVMKDLPFDERFRHYGYEDVFWGKQLEVYGESIVHINNPVAFCTFEQNSDFIVKTEEGLRTLRLFRNELKGYSPLLKVADKLERNKLKPLFACIFRVMGKRLKRLLLSKHTNLLAFQIYKLGYYLSLK